MLAIPFLHRSMSDSDMSYERISLLQGGKWTGGGKGRQQGNQRGDTGETQLGNDATQSKMAMAGMIRCCRSLCVF